MEISIPTEQLNSVLDKLSAEDSMIYDQYMHIKHKLLVSFVSCVYANNNHGEINRAIDSLKIPNNVEFPPEMIFFYNFESVIGILDTFIRFFDIKIKPMCSYDANVFVEDTDILAIKKIRNRLVEHFEKMQLPIEKAMQKHFNLSWKIDQIEERIQDIVNSVELHYLMALITKYEN